MAGKWLKRLAYRLGYDFTVRRLPQLDRRRKAAAIPRDMDETFVAIFEAAAPYTMTSPERAFALYQGVRHVVEQGIPGDFVECGVWRGGSCMVIASTLLAMGANDRRIVLFDTFSGMTRPGERDIRARDGSEQLTRWEASEREGHNEWAYAPLQEVRANLRATGYPDAQIVFVAGDVRETLPEAAPERIALLRLDTDWYESTYHEMVHLYPRLVPGGILLLDDYGSFQGAREAVDQYLAEQRIGLLLHRIDSTGRVAIKAK